jgi:O-antigen/teichoic acid export membrane protein/glycosyltransferase involved in cell wall biosynthesis
MKSLYRKWVRTFSWRALIENKSVSLNSFWNSFGFLIASICGFASTPISYEKLGKVEYGIWVFIMSTLQYSSVLYFGFGATIIKFVAEFNAKNDTKGLNKVISLFFMIYSGLGIVTVLFSAGVAWLLPSLINTPAAANWTYRLPVVISGLQMGLNFPLSVFGAILMGTQRYFFLSTSNLIVNILNLLIILLVPKQHCTLLFLSTSLFTTSTVGLLANYVFIKRIQPNLKLTLRNFDWEEARTLFTFSFKSFVMLIADKIVSLSDTFVIGIILGPGAVAIYSIPQRLVQYLQIMTQSASGVLFPKFSELEATGQSKQAVSYWLTGYKLSLALSMPISLLFFFYGDVIEKLWMGEDFGNNHMLLVILTAAYLFQQPVTRSFLVATNNHSLPSKLMLLEAVINLGLTLAFVKLWGMVGVSIGTFIPCFIIGTIIIPTITCRILGISFFSFVARGILPNLVAAVLPAALLWWLSAIGYGNTVVTFLITASASAALFFLLFFGKSIVKLRNRLTLENELEMQAERNLEKRREKAHIVTSETLESTPPKIRVTMLEGRDIICMNNDGLDGLRRPRAILMEMFSSRNRVLFVSSGSNSFLHRKGRQMLPFGGLQHMSDSFHWLAPPTIFWEIYNPSLAFLARASAYCRYLCLKLVALKLGFRKPLVYIAAPHAEFLLAARKLPCAAVVYNVHDKFLGEDGNWLPLHFDILKACDAVIVPSREIEAEAKRYHDKVYYHPPGVDTNLFRPMYPRYRIPAELADLKRPIIGLIGSLGHQMDWAMLNQVVQRKSDWYFVFIGPLIWSSLKDNKEYHALRDLPNVRFFPSQPHFRIPDLILGLDVCILPYLINNYTMGVNPLKLLEYLACGKPVVCSPIPAAHEFAGTILLARTPDEWVAALETALEIPPEEAASKGIAIAETYSYNRRIEALSKDLETIIAAKAKDEFR